MEERLTDRMRGYLPEGDGSYWSRFSLDLREAINKIEAQAMQIAELREERSKAIAEFPKLVESAKDKTGGCVVCGINPEMAAMVCDSLLKYKALCDQMAEILQAFQIGSTDSKIQREHEARTHKSANEALTAWREAKCS